MESRMTNPPTKAVILARGLGTRMRAASDATLTADQKRAADSGVKAMISVGRPFLDHVISALADAGFTDICLVIGPEHTMIKDYCDTLPKTRVRIFYAIQPQPLGTANALLAAEGFAGADRVLVINSDNYYPSEALVRLAQRPGSAVVGFDRKALVRHSNIPADRIAAFALIKADDGRLVDLVEKPDAETVAQMGIGRPGVDELLALLTLHLRRRPGHRPIASRRVRTARRREAGNSRRRQLRRRAGRGRGLGSFQP